MKRAIYFILVVVLLTVFISVLKPKSFKYVQAESNEITLIINGENIFLDKKAIIKNDRTFIPMRKIFNSLGAEVYWESQPAFMDQPMMHIINIIKDDQLFTMANGLVSAQNSHADGIWRLSEPQILPEIGSGEGISPEVWEYEDNEYIMSDQPFVEDGTTYFPVRLIAETLGAIVDWVNDKQTVIIKINDTVLKRSYEEMAQIESFPGEKADILFYSAKSNEEEILDYCVLFDKKGKFCEYSTYAEPEIYKIYRIYWDGNIVQRLWEPAY